MLTSDKALPSRITLNGADYFCLQLDKLMWKASRQRNVCTLAVALRGGLALADLQHHLDQRPAYQWLCRLRLRESWPFGLAKWVYDAKAHLPDITEYHVPALGPVPDPLLSIPLDIKSQSAFVISLLQCGDGHSMLVFTWHHVLMDAHGGELFVRHLGLSATERPPVWVLPEEPELALKTRGKIASDMKQFLYDTSALPLLSLYQASPGIPQACHRVLAFTTQETQLANEQARQLGAGFLPSAFYLAATTFAVATIQKQRGQLLGDVLVPVPLDCRKRGAPGAVLGNQVSFLFYRLPNGLLEDVPALTAELMAQMKALMRAESPRHYSIMMGLLRRMPGFFYRRLLQAPTKGLMSSFFYSDTGDSLQDFDRLFGQSVHSAVHYPPNMYPPGMTFIFSRCQGALQITLAYMDTAITGQEAEQLLAALRGVLLGSQA